MQVASRNLATYYKALQNPELYLTNALAAALMSRNEVFITLQRLLMQEELASYFFQNERNQLEKNENLYLQSKENIKFPNY